MTSVVNQRTSLTTLKKKGKFFVKEQTRLGIDGKNYKKLDPIFFGPFDTEDKASNVLVQRQLYISEMQVHMKTYGNIDGFKEFVYDENKFLGLEGLIQGAELRNQNQV